MPLCYHNITPTCNKVSFKQHRSRRARACGVWSVPAFYSVVPWLKTLLTNNNEANSDQTLANNDISNPKHTSWKLKSSNWIFLWCSRIGPHSRVHLPMVLSGYVVKVVLRIELCLPERNHDVVKTSWIFCEPRASELRVSVSMRTCRDVCSWR